MRGENIKQLPKYQISDFALKIACFQVLPGFEPDVIDGLEKACETQDAISNFVILKSLGHYDLVLLYVTPDFGDHLSKTPPIKGITKSNLFFCNFLGDTDPNFFIETIKFNSFAGISFIKINQKASQNWLSIFTHLGECLEKDNFEKFVIGTVGWNEFVIFLSGNEISNITDFLFEYDQDNLPKETKKLYLKSLSYLCFNKNLLPKNSWIKEGPVKTVHELNNIIHAQGNLLDFISVSISVNVKFPAINEALQYWESAGFKVSRMLGVNDIHVEPKGPITLASFLAYLFVFRFDFQSKLVGTTTHISKLDVTSVGKYISDKVTSLSYQERIAYSELAQIFGDNDITSNLNNILTALYGLANSPLTNDAFFGIAHYPNYLVDLGKAWIKDEKLKKYNISLAENAVSNIKKGIENRSYGVHGNIEGIVHGRLSKLSGGFQRAIVAVECIPAITMFKTGAVWKGFCTLGDKKFYHVCEVIGLPVNTLWNVNDWWPLYHEIGHILIDRTRNDNPDEAWISSKSSIIESFLTTRNNREEWLKLLTEFTAEVLGFEFGFFGDLDLFFELLWTHLNKVIPIEEEVVFKSYLLRSFFVLLFEEHFRKEDGISNEDIVDQDYLYHRFLEHINDVEKIIGKKISRKHFIAGVNAKNFAELYPFSKHLNEKMLAADSEVKPFNHPGIRPDKKSLESDLTKEILSSVKNGEVWLNDKRQTIPYEAVLYNIFKEGKQSLNTNIALILTFWHIHMDFINFKQQSLKN